MSTKGYPTQDEFVSVLKKIRTTGAKGGAGLSLVALMALLGGCGQGGTADDRSLTSAEPEEPSHVGGEREIMGVYDSSFDE